MFMLIKCPNNRLILSAAYVAKMHKLRKKEGEDKDQLICQTY
jgi:hypothetical protein